MSSCTGATDIYAVGHKAGWMIASNRTAMAEDANPAHACQQASQAERVTRLITRRRASTVSVKCPRPQAFRVDRQGQSHRAASHSRQPPLEMQRTGALH
jgi:hypothetical protein